MLSMLIEDRLNEEGVVVRDHIWARRDYIDAKWGSTAAHYTHSEDTGWELVFDGPGPIPPMVASLIKAHAILVDAGL